MNRMLGKVFTSVRKNEDFELIFENDTESFTFHHEQDCCEHVRIEDICGELTDLENSPIIQAEESSNVGIAEDDYTSQTWTFYRFATNKGFVTVRWLGESNGYYSESVDLKYTSKEPK